MNTKPLSVVTDRIHCYNKGCVGWNTFKTSITAMVHGFVLFLLLSGGILRRHVPVGMFISYIPGNQTWN
jgi:hypothetical protein